MPTAGKNRRQFLKYSALATTAGAGVSAWWTATSERRLARWLRTIMKDGKRDPAPAPFRPYPAQWSDQQVTIAWLGHATVLINFFGVSILTDPAFGPRVGVSLGLMTAGPKRFIQPALRLRELPRIDVVLLSHAHMDHMDLQTLRALKPTAGIVTASLTRDILPGKQFAEATELKWNQRTTVQTPNGPLEIQAFEVKHWGQRWPSELARGYNGYILRREGRAILFGGDTAFTPLFTDLRPQGPYEAAIMPIAAYRPWIRNHCTPEEALEMVNAAGGRYLVPIHHQTFKLSDEPMDEPIQRLAAALDNEPQRLALRSVGETFVLPI